YDYGSAAATVVSNGGEQDVYGNASGTVVSSGGLLFVESGAVVTGATVASGGEVIISGGTFSGTLASGAIQIDEVVSSGATVSNETITSGILQSVLSGGNTSSITIVSTGEQDISGGTDTATVIASGGVQYIYSGVASGTTICNGGTQYVSGTAAGAAILSGGEQLVYSSAANTTVSSGGIEIVDAGAVASGTTVLSGGEIVIYSGASTPGLTVSSGGIVVSSGGSFAPMNAAAHLTGGATATPGAQSSTPPATQRQPADPAAAATEWFRVSSESQRDTVPLPSPITPADTPHVDATVANLIQAAASFDALTGAKAGALFNSSTGHLLHEEINRLAESHLRTRPRQPL